MDTHPTGSGGQDFRFAMAEAMVKHAFDSMVGSDGHEGCRRLMMKLYTGLSLRHGVTVDQFAQMVMEFGEQAGSVLEHARKEEAERAQSR